jgi:hypothetical protein
MLLLKTVLKMSRFSRQCWILDRPPLWSIGYRSGGSGSIPVTTRKKRVVGLERGPLSLVSSTEELLDRKVAVSCLENRENTAGGIRHADHVAPSIRTSMQSLHRQAAVARSV